MGRRDCSYPSCKAAAEAAHAGAAPLVHTFSKDERLLSHADETTSEWLADVCVLVHAAHLRQLVRVTLDLSLIHI